MLRRTFALMAVLSTAVQQVSSFVYQTRFAVTHVPNARVSERTNAKPLTVEDDEGSGRRNFLSSAYSFTLGTAVSLSTYTCPAYASDKKEESSLAGTKPAASSVDDPLASFGASLSGMSNPTNSGISTSGAGDNSPTVGGSVGGAAPNVSLDDALKQSGKKRSVEPRTHG